MKSAKKLQKSHSNGTPELTSASNAGFFPVSRCRKDALVAVEQAVRRSASESLTVALPARQVSQMQIARAGWQLRFTFYTRNVKRNS